MVPSFLFLLILSYHPGISVFWDDASPSALGDIQSRLSAGSSRHEEESELHVSEIQGPGAGVGGPP